MKKEIQNFEEVALKEKIFTIRGLQVMLDRDLAKLYKTDTRTLKQAVKRNLNRFPEDFMLKLNKNEIRHMVSQSVIPSKKYLGGAEPFVFTELGVSMLSSILKTPLAVEISLKIIRTFIEMRKFINSNAQIFQRLDRVEIKQIETDNKFDKVFSALENNDHIPKQGIFFEGQIFKAYKFVSDIFRTAKSSIVIIDNYIDDTVLTHLAKKSKNVEVKILTKSISKQLKLDIDKFENEFFAIEVQVYKKSHDRFIIIDDEVVYHFGASLKDLGKKLFGFSRFEIDVLKTFGDY